MKRNEHLLLHPPQKPVIQPSTQYEMKLAMARNVDVTKRNEAISRIEAEFLDSDVVEIGKRVVERDLRLFDGKMRLRLDGSRGGFKLLQEEVTASPAVAAKSVIPAFVKKTPAPAAVASLFGGGAKSRLGSLIKKTSLDALRQIAVGPTSKMRVSEAPTTAAAVDEVSAARLGGSSNGAAAASDDAVKGRPSSAPHSRVKQLHRDPFYYDSLHHKDRHSHDHIGLGNGEVVKDKKRSGHSAYIYLDSRGKIHVQLKSKSSKTRPKSAQMSKFRSYKDKKIKMTMNDVIKVLKGGKATKIHSEECGIADPNLPSSNRDFILDSSAVNKDKMRALPTTAAAAAAVDFDFEAADKRRLKTVQFHRERLSQLSSKRLKMREYMQYIASTRDVNLQEGKRVVCGEKGKLDTLVVERLALENFYHAMGGHGWRRSDNWLSDRPVGEWFGICTNHLGAVRDLRLENNVISGELTTALSDLEFLEVLVLDGNRIIGQLPGHVIAGWKYLEVLSLRSNRLEGPLLLNLLAKKQLLREVWLSDNQLSGTLHEDIGLMRSLTHFCVYKNRFSGCIPQTIGQLHALELLSLGRNCFSGPIPHALRSCIKLTHLSLHSNDFTGRVPEYFMTFPCLLELNLWRNMFDGEVPLKVAREVIVENERCAEG